MLSPSRVGLETGILQVTPLYRYWQRRKSEFCNQHPYAAVVQAGDSMSSLSAYRSLSGRWILPHYPNNALPKGGPLKKAISGSSTQTEDPCPCPCCSSVRTGHLLWGSNTITQHGILIHDLRSETPLGIT